MSKIKQILRLHDSGVALQTIARAINSSRNTVRKYLRLIEVRRLPPQELLSMDDEALEALLQDPDPQTEARLDTLTELFPYFDQVSHCM